MTGIFCIAIVACSTSAADILVEKSRSPDGRYAFWVVDPGEEAGAVAGLSLREVSSGEVIHSFLEGGYIGVAKELAKDVKVLWSPDSQWFALNLRDSKWSRGISFYLMLNGKIRKVSPPSYTQNIFGREGIVQNGRYLIQKPIGWKDHKATDDWTSDHFELTVEGTVAEHPVAMDPSEWYKYRVRLELSAGKNRAPEIRIEAIEEMEYTDEEERD